MSRTSSDLVELDVERLFEERSVAYIVQVEKLLDTEIQRKRSELRSMVGDRYKDVLAASDAIKSMKETSGRIVGSIEKIMDTCERLVTDPIKVDDGTLDHPQTDRYNRWKDEAEERTILIQIRLAIFMNEQIWSALDEEDNLNAAQYYLLAQHIHTGLSLSRREYLDRVPVLHHIKENLIVLRSRIFEKITEKLESVEITAQETSHNLNALMLLENQSVCSLLNIFIEHRKTALNTVINMPYSNVRVQVSSMVKCLITTVRLLHECFITVENSKKGLIWQQIEDMCSDSSPATLSKLKLPVTPLICYVPEIIKQFRPICKVNTLEHLTNAESVMKEWLGSTKSTVTAGLKKFLQLITNVKGLHLTREESLKIKPPHKWDQICQESYLPDEFDVWYYFFQPEFTLRCKEVVVRKVASNISEVQSFIKGILGDSFASSDPEINLRYATWKEEADDVSKYVNEHKGLSMKTRGYSKIMVNLCEKMDAKYMELLEDISQYLYSEEYNNVSPSVNSKEFKFNKRKHADKSEIEKHVGAQTVQHSLSIPAFITSLLNQQHDTHDMVPKSIFCARFLSAVVKLCPNFKKCCNFNNSPDDWITVCDNLSKTGQVLWRIWVEDVKGSIGDRCEALKDVSARNMVKVLTRWDEIEIQERTDEKVFTSRIRVPLKPSVPLTRILSLLNDKVNEAIPHTLPKSTHLHVIEENCVTILDSYSKLLFKEKKTNQKHALQFLFDVKFVTTLCVPRENVELMGKSQDVCDKLRAMIDPFDLDVFYPYLQGNVKRAVLQSQAILGCLLPSSVQLDSLGISEKSKEQELNPTVLNLSVPSNPSWFPLLPIMAPFQKMPGKKPSKDLPAKMMDKAQSNNKVVQDSASAMRQSAASLFGGLATDWFS